MLSILQFLSSSLGSFQAPFIWVSRHNLLVTSPKAYTALSGSTEPLLTANREHGMTKSYGLFIKTGEVQVEFVILNFTFSTCSISSTCSHFKNGHMLPSSSTRRGTAFDTLRRLSFCESRKNAVCIIHFFCCYDI